MLRVWFLSKITLLAALIESELTGARGVARIFQGGGGGVTRCQNEATCQIVMSFLPPVVGCLLKTWLTKGGGGCHGHPRTPLATPLGVHMFTDIRAILLI